MGDLAVNAAQGTPAIIWCEQCGIFYCEECRDRCHPQKGPLLKHTLHSAQRGAEIVRQKRQNKLPACPAHPHEAASQFCLACRVALCNECIINDPAQLTCVRSPNKYGQHVKQELQPLQTFCKNKKGSMSIRSDAGPVVLSKCVTGLYRAACSEGIIPRPLQRGRRVRSGFICVCRDLHIERGHLKAEEEGVIIS
ncbi:unnamed protein product [Dibothriocephalus latus]|uniref:B box-type domain-containing protein n=1 Tax=Dibothriocephalus latus TaxID=60516 RepID=A0A3P6TAC5_DIBLA|nr:unnamed protein product [Dibothriocephalus latus]